MCSSTTPSPCVSSSIWTTHWATYNSTSRFHLGTSAPSYPFQHIFWWDIWSSSCLNFIMFSPRGKHLAYNSTNLPNLFDYLPQFFAQYFIHNLDYPILQLHASFDVCAHIPLTLWGSTSYVVLMAMNAHWNPWCNSQHLCHHCMKCWFPHGIKIVTCASFNHIQFLSSTNRHFCLPTMAFEPWPTLSLLTQCE